MYNTYLYIRTLVANIMSLVAIERTPIHHTIHAAKILMLPNAFSKLPINSLSFIFIILYVVTYIGTFWLRTTSTSLFQKTAHHVFGYQAASVYRSNREADLCRSSPRSRWNTCGQQRRNHQALAQVFQPHKAGRYNT